MISRSGDYISQIKHVGGRVFERLLAASGIDAFNGPQGKILDALWQEDALAAGELGQRTGLANSTLTGMLDRMEAAGLIERSRSERDRRVVAIRLTARARDLRQGYEAVSAQMTQIYFRGFAEAEVRRFEADLRRVLENVQDALASERTERRDGE